MAANLLASEPGDQADEESAGDGHENAGDAQMRLRQIGLGERKPPEIGDVRAKPDQAEQREAGNDAGAGDDGADRGDEKQARARGEIAERSGLAASHVRVPADRNFRKGSNNIVLRYTSVKPFDRRPVPRFAGPDAEADGEIRVDLTEDDYAALAEFRYLIRRFLEFSETEAKRAGLTPRQHQALLAIKGFGRGKPVAVRDLAERLRIRHNTTVELADRLVESGLVERVPDDADHRLVLLRLTQAAEHRLAALSSAHLDELSRLRPLMEQAFRRPP